MSNNDKQEQIMTNPEITVWELGDNGDAWFAENASDEAAARKAIQEWLATVLDGDDLTEAESTLAEVTATVGRWWFSTGHAEGQMVNEEEPPKWLEGIRFE